VTGSGEGTSHCCQPVRLALRTLRAKGGLRHAAFIPSAATRTSAKSRFGGCMNGPDTAEGGRNPKSPTEYRRRIKSSAFFRERIRGLRNSQRAFRGPALRAPLKQGLTQGLVLFRYRKPAN
jgi:hypothetical protein